MRGEVAVERPRARSHQARLARRGVDLDPGRRGHVDDRAAVTPTLDAIVLTPLATQGSPLRSLVVDGSDSVRVDLEDDVGAFTVALPRIRVIPIERFDPWTLLG